MTSAPDDASEFSALVERHRRELHLHCYRMLGSFEEAEDRVQETLLRAWRKRSTFEGRSTVRTWLYAIATNACLEVLRRHPRKVVTDGTTGRLPPYSDLPWLQPYPDQLLDEVVATEAEPEAIAVSRETIELAFLAAIQLLPPRQRAVLILREVLAFSAAETAALLDGTVPAVNSALQRARSTLARYHPPADEDRMPTTAATAEERALLQRFMDAHEQADPAAVIELLRDDARLTISPMQMCWDGREDIAPDFLENMSSLGEFRCVPMRANRQPAVANYLRKWGESDYEAFTIVVLGIDDGAIVDLTTFAEPNLFEMFGLPPTVA